MLLPENALTLPLTAILAFAGAAVVTLALGRRVIPWLSARGMQDGEGRKASETLNELNAGKKHTPTMGGLFIMLALVVCAVIVLPANPVVWAVLGATLVTAALGAVDDWAKLHRRKGDGLRGRTKLVVQAVAAAGAAWVMMSEMGGVAESVFVPVIGVSIPLGVLFIPWAVFVTVGTSNAVNLSDGLDGLAGGMMLVALLAFAGIAFAVGSPELATTFNAPYVAGANDAGLLAMMAAGAVLGFLWFNVHPAQVFMGDTGSLALGTLLGLLALSMRQELLLAVVGAMFVAEAMSVMIQVGFFKLSKGRRVFRCAPLHHHFQFGGMSEVKVTLRFWLLAGVFAALGLTAFAWPTMSGRADVEVADVASVEEPRLVMRD